MVKRLPAMRETWVRSVGQEEPLEKEMATQYPVFLPGILLLDGRAWWATVHGVTKSRTRVSRTVSGALEIRGIPSKSSQSS